MKKINQPNENFGICITFEDEPFFYSTHNLLNICS